MRQLTTALEVVEALGGIAAVCELTGANYKTVYHWTGRAGAFPARTADLMAKALRKQGATAPPSLWNMLKAKPKTKTKRAA